MYMESKKGICKKIKNTGEFEHWIQKKVTPEKQAVRLVLRKVKWCAGIGIDQDQSQ